MLLEYFYLCSILNFFILDDVNYDFFDDIK